MRRPRPRIRDGLLYRLRRHGVRCDTRQGLIFLPLGSPVDCFVQIPPALPGIQVCNPIYNHMKKSENDMKRENENLKRCEIDVKVGKDHPLVGQLLEGAVAAGMALRDKGIDDSMMPAVLTLMMASWELMAIKGGLPEEVALSACERSLETMRRNVAALAADMEGWEPG